ncbi:chloride channel protein 2-like isoform X3 [Mizuhopecten yessoensis]|uniref:Chloride channel protein 2 n=1 Tax=Mizuhopecten yessoensis TaxID=6573 RepID=A0A210QTK0_MIZYE|nr:chloride channel protein 2-like isoform X3 [Mizuhopecten yessoensis]OWF52055.1 Chloride channel protein 2 [Mizuhopecten yessoensis]
MAEKEDLGYEQTLLYGKYSKDLGSFAKFQAKRLKKEKTDLGNVEKPKKGLYFYLVSHWIIQRCTHLRDIVFRAIGEDWIFLALLGVLMALLSFTMDYIIEKCQEAKLWLYEEVAFSVGLQYLAWTFYSIIFILFATGFTHLVAPQAVGSGIPEMKTILRGVVLKEFLTFKTLLSKIVGLCSSLGSTLPIGKEGPFVHIASIVATLLGKLTSFRGIYENESRRSEMLAAACAVGVAGTFAAPIGGVLFSIEVTATYFAVRNYWRGFFAAVCGALVFRLLALWFKNEDTITALFRTSLRTDFPFDALELLAYAFIGVVCGFGGALFILLHRKIILFTRKQKRMTIFLQKNRFIYPGLVALVIASLTFPPGLGQFFAGNLTSRQAINELFSNITWTTGQADNLAEEEIISHWKHPDTNIYVNLVIFIVMNFWFGAICNTLPIPAGVFVPVFTVGAAFGRLVGEGMAAWFPEGIPSGNVIRKIVPGGYAVVGAASLSGSVTRTISTSVIVFELTGQISHVLPAVVAVLIANAIANQLQPSFYDSIIKLKRLPYLPDIVSSKSSMWNVYVEDIMVQNVQFVSFVSSYGHLKDLITQSIHKSYPLVDSPDSMILLGSIQRFELERILMLHLSYDQKILISNFDDDTSETRTPNSELSTAQNSRAPSPAPIPALTITDSSPSRSSRFQVQKVDEPQGGSGGGGASKLPNPFRMRFSKSSSSLTEMSDEAKEAQTYHTLQLPLRSILKNSSSTASMGRASSTSDLKSSINAYYDQFRNQRKDSIVEDMPFVINKGSFQNLAKKVRLPPEPVRVKNLPTDKQQLWEEQQLSEIIDWEGCQIDPAPFQLVERTSLHKVHSLFSLLGLNHAYVTNAGKLVGVCGLKELRKAIQGRIDAQANGQHPAEDDEDSEVEDIDPQDLKVIPSVDQDYTLVNTANPQLSDETELHTFNLSEV